MSNLSVCPFCGGSATSLPGRGGGRSHALRDLLSDIGQTCFCKVPGGQLEQMLQEHEKKWEALVKQYFPDCMSMEDVMSELRGMDRSDVLYVTMVKRFDYLRLMRDALKRKIKEREKMASDLDRDNEGVRTVFRDFSSEEAKQQTISVPRRMPKVEGGSLRDWMRDAEDN